MNRREMLLNSLSLGTLASPRGRAAAMQQPALPIIDSHCHAGKGSAMEEPWNTYADPEVILRRAEKAGISQTIIFPINNETYEKANEDIAGIVSRYPDRFIGFAKHDSETEGGSIRELLIREVKELGLKGLKLHRHPTREVLDTVAELGIPVLYHPGRVRDLHLIADSYSQINFIVAHLGSFASRSWSEHVAAIDVAGRFANVFLETSSVVFFEFLEMAARELAPEKLIFGSDGPLVDSRVELHKIRLLGLPREAERKILCENISALLNL